MIKFRNIEKIILYGVSPSGKAAGFGPAIQRFESFHPSTVRTQLIYAPMVELVDTLVLETNALCLRVRVSLGALTEQMFRTFVRRFM